MTPYSLKATCQAEIQIWICHELLVRHLRSRKAGLSDFWSCLAAVKSTGAPGKREKKRKKWTESETAKERAVHSNKMTVFCVKHVGNCTESGSPAVRAIQQVKNQHEKVFIAFWLLCTVRGKCVCGGGGECLLRRETFGAQFPTPSQTAAIVAPFYFCLDWSRRLNKQYTSEGSEGKKKTVGFPLGNSLLQLPLASLAIVRCNLAQERVQVADLLLDGTSAGSLLTGLITSQQDTKAIKPPWELALIFIWGLCKQEFKKNTERGEKRACRSVELSEVYKSAGQMRAALSATRRRGRTREAKVRNFSKGEQKSRSCPEKNKADLKVWRSFPPPFLWPSPRGTKLLFPLLQGDKAIDRYAPVERREGLILLPQSRASRLLTFLPHLTD